MDEQLYSVDPLSGQAQPDGLISEYARSSRGDFRVIAAILRIDQENAEADLEAAELEAIAVDLVAISGDGEGGPPPKRVHERCDAKEAAP
jgi:hypothetical protein